MRSRNHKQKRITYIGSELQCDQFKSWLAANPSSGFELASHYDFEGSLKECGPQKWLDKILADHDHDEVLIGSFEKRNEVLHELIDIAEEQGCRVRIIQDSEDVNGTLLDSIAFGPFQTIAMRKEPLAKPIAHIAKRSFDVLFSTAIFLTMYWWVYILAGLIIKISSKGPVYFKQRRVGRSGKIFYCYKFRTMRLNGGIEEEVGEQLPKKDPRITPVGNFLRKTDLDEFPQFINVFKGEMSVIGPRPHMVEEDYGVADRLKKYRIRRFIRPGITGWAAVNGYRGGTKDMALMQKRVDHDLAYIEEWTPWLDTKIIFMTVIQMFGGNPGSN